MFAESLLPAVRERLATIVEDAPLVEAARLLRTGTDIILVCSADGFLRGVVTKTDIVSQISRCTGAGCIVATSVAMSRDVMSCRSSDPLDDLWRRMKMRKLKNIPYLDDESRPLGVLNARDLLQALLRESTAAEDMMRDYIMGVGYR